MYSQPYHQLVQFPTSQSAQYWICCFFAFRSWNIWMGTSKWPRPSKSMWRTCWSKTSTTTPHCPEYLSRFANILKKSLRHCLSFASEWLPCRKLCLRRSVGLQWKSMWMAVGYAVTSSTMLGTTRERWECCLKMATWWTPTLEKWSFEMKKTMKKVTRMPRMPRIRAKMRLKRPKRRRKTRRKRRKSRRRIGAAVVEVEVGQVDIEVVAGGGAHQIGPDTKDPSWMPMRLKDYEKKHGKMLWLVLGRSMPRDRPQLKVNCGVVVVEMLASACWDLNMWLQAPADPPATNMDRIQRSAAPDRVRRRRSTNEGQILTVEQTVMRWVQIMQNPVQEKYSKHSQSQITPVYISQKTFVIFIFFWTFILFLRMREIYEKYGSVSRATSGHSQGRGTEIDQPDVLRLGWSTAQGLKKRCRGESGWMFDGWFYWMDIDLSLIMVQYLFFMLL